MASEAHDGIETEPGLLGPTPRRYLGLTILFLAMAAALSVFRLPAVLGWRSNAFQDAGANLTIDYLTAIGDRPGIDNGYIYGLLCLWVGRLWCGLFGLTPYAASPPGSRRTSSWAGGWPASPITRGSASPAWRLMLVEMVPGKDQTFVYILEPVFVVHALAEQARGRRSSGAGPGDARAPS